MSAMPDWFIDVLGLAGFHQQIIANDFLVSQVERIV